VTGLNAGTTYEFVVRAEDQAGNIDPNTVEVTATTQPAPPPAVSFSTQVQPIFTAKCVGCHSGGTPPNLSTGSAYSAIVSVAAGQCSSASYVVPGSTAQSYLIATITPAGSLGTCSGGMMSSYATSSDVSTISTWIAQGAPNN
jgi:hypothetical protein